MGLLKSVDNVPGIDFYEYRDQLYYGKYKYKTNFVLEGSQYLYGIKQEYQLLNRLHSIRISDTRKDLIKKNLDELMAFIGWRKNFSTGKNRLSTSRTEGSKISVFSNDLTLFETLKPLCGSSELKIIEAKVAQYSGVKYFVNEPKHRYRVYLKSLITSPKLKAEFSKFIKSQKSLYPSLSMRKWLDGDEGGSLGWFRNYINSSYSIDYDDEQILSYLMLMHGDFVGKCYKLEKHPEL